MIFENKINVKKKSRTSPPVCSSGARFMVREKVLYVHDKSENKQIQPYSDGKMVFNHLIEIDKNYFLIAESESAARERNSRN